MKEADERSDAEAMMVAHLSWIERTTASLARRYGLDPDEASDVDAWIKVRLVEDDYAVFRKFRGESSIRTYLVVVVSTLFREYRSRGWGRWRPSAAAVRHGGLAVRLETLIYRDGLSVAQAGEVLRSEDPYAPNDRTLAQMLAQLPERVPSSPDRTIDDPLHSSADAVIQADEAQRRQERLQLALDRAMEALPEQDRLILRLRYWEGMSLGAIARALRLEQKPLYRRMERLTKELRRHLESEGIDGAMIREALEGPRA